MTNAASKNLAARVDVLGRDRRRSPLVATGNRADHAQGRHPPGHDTAPRAGSGARWGDRAVQDLLAIERLPDLHQPVDAAVGPVRPLDALIRAALASARFDRGRFLAA